MRVQGGKSRRKLEEGIQRQRWQSDWGEHGGEGRKGVGREGRGLAGR